MGYLRNLYANYRYPVKHRELESEVSAIFANFDKGISTNPTMVKYLQDIVSELGSNYKKGMALGGALLSLGVATLAFGPELAENAGYSDAVQAFIFGTGAAGGLAGLVHLIRSASLNLELKEYLPEGTKYALLSMKTPEKPM